MAASEVTGTAKEAARTAAETTRTTLNSLAGGFSNLVSLNSALFEAYSEAGRAYVKQISALSEELTAFTNRRLKEQAEAREVLSKCKDWSDAVRTQQEFLQDSSRDYLDQASKIFKILGQATFAGMNPFVERMEHLPEKLTPAVTPVATTPKAA